jgi:hypothetical protein
MGGFTLLASREQSKAPPSEREKSADLADGSRKVPIECARENSLL